MSLGPGDRVAVVVNRGSGPAPLTPESVASALAARGVRPHIVAPESGAEIPAAARSLVADGYTVVVAAGGDGTVSAVASQLAGTGVRLGVLPGGTLNHLARDLGIPAELERAADVLVAARTAAIDAGEVNGRVFINNVSLGLYPAFVEARGSVRGRSRLGKLVAIARAALGLVRRVPLLSARLVVDGAPMRRITPLVFVGNNACLIDGPGIGRRPRLCDGRLTLIMTRRRLAWGLIKLAVRAALGTLRGERDLDHLEAREVVVRARPRRVRLAIDGELATMAMPLVCRTRPGALRVIVPGPGAGGPADAAATIAGGDG